MGNSEEFRHHRPITLFCYSLVLDRVHYNKKEFPQICVGPILYLPQRFKFSLQKLHVYFFRHLSYFADVGKQNMSSLACGVVEQHEFNLSFLLLTYLLTPWCRVLLEKLTPVHIPTSHLLEIHPNIIHPSTPRSPQWSLSLRFENLRVDIYIYVYTIYTYIYCIYTYI